MRPHRGSSHTEVARLTGQLAGKGRPPLPGGPWLVVGLARSGRAALELLRARGEDARGVDRQQGDDGPEALRGVRAVAKSPGVPREARVIAAALERGLPVLAQHPRCRDARPRQPHHEVRPLRERRPHWPGIDA